MTTKPEPRQSPAARICPRCDHSDEILAGGPLWPAGRRCPGCGFEPEFAGGIALLAPDVEEVSVGMNPEEFQKLSKVEDDHFWFRTRNRLLTGLARKYCGEARSFLEIGCGNGAVLRAMRHERAWRCIAGAEFHVTALRIARRRLGASVELGRMDARKILIRGAFDLIGAFDVIEHIADDEGVLRQLRAALASDGSVMISVPQHPFLWSSTDVAAMHARRYRRGELESKLVAAGFKVLASTSFVCLLLPAMVASRLMNPGNGKRSKIAADSEFSLPPWLNQLFGAITDCEVWLTLRGLRWPIGGSRVVVARRTD